MKLQFADFNSLKIGMVKYITEREGACVYAFSDDVGHLSIRIEEVVHEGFYYRAVKLMNVQIPESTRGRGAYASLITAIDETQCFGIRWHDTVYNHFLAARHEKRGYFKQYESYYTVTGEPIRSGYQASTVERQPDLKKSILFKRR